MSQAVGYALRRTTMSSEMMLSLIYLNGKVDPNQMFLVFMVFPIRSAYLVWLYVIIDFYEGSALLPSFLLIAATHAFYYAKEIMPALPFAKHLFQLQTPQAFLAVNRHLQLDQQPFEFPAFAE